MYYLQLKSFIRKRKKIFSLLLIQLLLFSITLTLINIRFSISYKFKYKIFQQIENRQIYVEGDITEAKLITLIKKVSTIEKTYKYFEPKGIYMDEYGYILMNIYINDDLKLIKGSMFDMSSKKQVIIPSFFYNKGKIISADKLLNKTISIPIESSNEDDYVEYTVVGIYENDKSTTMNHIYVNDMEFNSDELLNKFIIRLSSYQDVDIVVNYLNSKGLSASLYDDSTKIELQSYLNMETILTSFIHISIFIVLLLMYLIVSIIVNMFKMDIMIFKMFGYNLSSIFCLIFLPISFIMNFVLSLMILIFHNLQKFVIITLSEYVYVILLINILIFICIFINFKRKGIYR